MKMPAPSPPAKTTGENKEIMREWTSVNGRAARQTTVRQEATMAKTGTLPESFYHQELKSTDANENVG